MLSIRDSQILDPILIANEVVKDYRARKKKGWILKIDLEKAFDWVNCSFLDNTLKHMGFHPKWIEWTNVCIRHPKFLIFINGRPQGFIQASKGIPQGDTLSPFLFLLISEVLSLLISQAHQSGLFEGFTVGTDKIHLSIW